MLALVLLLFPDGSAASAAGPDGLQLGPLPLRHSLYLPTTLHMPPGPANVAFDPPRGVYDGPVTLRLSTPSGDRIRFTADGSEPSVSHGLDYGGPLQVGANMVIRARVIPADGAAGPVATHTYVFPEATIQQPRHPEGFPKTWGLYKGEPVEADYAMDPEVVSDPMYREQIVRDLKTLPTVSLSTDPGGLFGATGIYDNPLDRGRDWERPASLEVFGGAGLELQVDCGVRIAGGYSRQPDANRKHSFSLRFRKDYGPGLLEARLFPDSPAEEFDTLRLRAGQADSFEFYPGRAQYIHDEWGRRTQLASGSPAALGRFVHLYVNGLYWGLYNFAEELDSEFAEEHMGGQDAEYDVIKQSVNLGAEADEGNMDAFNAMLAIDPSSHAGYTALQDVLDVAQYIDYTIIQMYGANRDWPDNNWTAIRRRVPGGRFQFFVWDYEQVAQLWADDPYVDGTDTDGAAGLHGRLYANETYRVDFGDRVQKMLVDPGGALRPAAAAERYRELATQVEPGIVPESARWGDAIPGFATYSQNRDAWDDFWRANDHGHPQTYHDEWVPERNRLLAEFFPRRTAVLIDQLQRRGLFPRTPAPILTTKGRIVTLQGNTNLYYTVDGTDPRSLDGTPRPTAAVYRRPFLVSSYSLVKARARSGDEWSPIVEAEVGTPRLRVSEFMYHPEDGLPEFIEIENPLDAAVDLSGAEFSDGIEYEFAEGIELAPGARMVLTGDPDAFSVRYPGVVPDGVFAKNLSNGGERVRLENADGEALFDILYADDGLWPVGPDGLGWALVPVDGGDPDRPEGWRAGAVVGGTPGRPEPEPMPAPAVVISEILANSDGAYEDAIELVNLSDAPVDVGGWYLSDDRDTLADVTKYQIPPDTVIPAGGYRMFFAADFDAGDDGFGLGGDGEAAYLSQAVGGELTGEIRGFEFPALPPNVTFGRVVTSVGPDIAVLAEPGFGLAAPPADEEAFRLAPGGPNAEPRVGAVVISEIMYHPAGEAVEWIELHNPGPESIDLGPTADEPPWALGRGIDLDFPAGAVIEPGGYMVVSEDPGALGQVPPGVPVLGPFDGQLDNHADEIRLLRPVPGESDPGEPARTWEDRVAYRDAAPWPLLADGEGPSLERQSPSAYGNDPASWFGRWTGGSPGRASPELVRVWLPLAVNQH